MESDGSGPVDLDAAFATGVEDPVSLLTLLELSIEQSSAGDSGEEQQEFLRKLLQLLEDHPKVTAVISWDLPNQLMKFLVPRNVALHKNLRSIPIVSPLMRCFLVVAVSGDPRDTLLCACTLFEGVSADDEINRYITWERASKTADAAKSSQEVKADGDSDGDDTSVSLERSPGDLFVGLKLHILFELVTAALKRIKTLYPSKYLGMTVFAIEKAITKNSGLLQDPSIILRRGYSFCRNYEPTAPPREVILTNDAKLTEDELHSTIENELELQRRLLRRLCTSTVGEGLKSTTDRSEVKYYYKLCKKREPRAPFYELLVDVKSRLYDLANSFDISLKDELVNCIAESKKVYGAVPQVSAVRSKEARKLIEKQVLKLSLSHQLQRMTKDLSMQLNMRGIVALSSIFYLVEDEHLYPEMHLSDAVYLYLWFVSPALLSKANENLSVEGAIRYFMWVSVTQHSCSELREDLYHVSGIVLAAFFRCLLLRCCAERSAMSRSLGFTLLTRLLCSCPEKVSFAFIVDTLQSFPYMQGRTFLLGVLRDMFLTALPSGSFSREDKSETVVQDKSVNQDDLSAKLSQLEIGIGCSTFMNLTRERMDVLTDLMVDSVDALSQASDPQISFVEHFPDFITPLQGQWDPSLFERVIAKLRELTDHRTIQDKLDKLE
ncbi:Ybp1p KNAG_0M00830 [Huiozyma naganishii CBS 8797]|uniref:Uncharacterized protein n=1 Tax=Huiozyma naganishii (strain ATCC MYA-139 / BCRC 22969 / CBS 8797 / KCTC 17520 / NBRC 10181 / NCYC 3082 / Yp74L-3) TaxID=1071383 RepID=J7SBB8_HUIN7|nr:hypothetical protein KNAG_0M00830 [Kazachstania naganishii CBS 8797]CCK72936.1 hypothetical protein KNAG_0M00830 [Kazachstania naganishii CBS 8797]